MEPLSKHSTTLSDKASRDHGNARNVVAADSRTETVSSKTSSPVKSRPSRSHGSNREPRYWRNERGFDEQYASNDSYDLRSETRGGGYQDNATREEYRMEERGEIGDNGTRRSPRTDTDFK
ncbi:hypothetical protein HK096_011641 [Nowakowskiella sp. JEL0078]|nr:hypothetical protein HK096_011641 [Nowakowskiella sp. JEL0078]